MIDQTIICQDCRVPFTLNAGEKNWYEQRLEKDPRFRMPKRCKSCRERRKNSNGRPDHVRNLESQPKSPHAVHYQQNDHEDLPPTPEERGVARADLSKTKPNGDEIRIVLATTDFEDLVSGRAVYVRGNKVRIILADIGFSQMRAAIDRAEVDKKLSAP